MCKGAGGPDVLEVRHLPDPEPAPDEVLIAITASAVNRADLMQRRGAYPPPPGASEVLGLECAGTIEKVGSQVTRWRPGDQVCALLTGGGYAERVAVPAGQEKYHQPGDGGWLPFVFGCLAGIVPWLAVLIYVIAPGSTSGAEPPAFVYGIIVSLFVFFNIFALVQWAQYKQVGRFRDYLVGERTYITLSLVAKSLLAWQVFGGTLAP